MNTIILQSVAFLLFTTKSFGFVVKNKSTTTTFFSKTSSLNMAVEVGQKIPEVTLMEGAADYGKPQNVHLPTLIAGKKVIIFAVPGAFTPGCSKSHLPSFITAKDELKKKGIDMVICVATNDAFVMEAWGRTSGGTDAGIKFLSDANAELTRAFDLEMASDVFARSKRYSLIADDGVITHYFSADKESSDTWAPNVLSSL